MFINSNEKNSNVLNLFTLETFYRYIGQTDKLALLLDYDGTLAPIAPHPDLAILPLETKSVLERLSNMPDVFVAIVSGRNVHNVKEMVSLKIICIDGKGEFRQASLLLPDLKCNRYFSNK